MPLKTTEPNIRPVRINEFYILYMWIRPKLKTFGLQFFFNLLGMGRRFYDFRETKCYISDVKANKIRDLRMGIIFQVKLIILVATNLKDHFGYTLQRRKKKKEMLFFS